MRFDFDTRKQEARANPKRGIGFEEAQKSSSVVLLDARSDGPEQYRGDRLGGVAECTP